MPSKNSRKEYVAEGYYHVYNRGVEKRKIFIDDEDYAVFLNLLKRYLDDRPHKDKKAREYPWLHEDLTLLAFCLMSNHFHLFILQEKPDVMTKLLQGVCTSYTGYFNKKYKRVGPLFQGRYKASRIINDSYLQHISRYIHLNAKEYKSYPFSSYKYYVEDAKAGWINPKPILDGFEGESYQEFVADYESQKELMDDLKHELADN